MKYLLLLLLFMPLSVLQAQEKLIPPSLDLSYQGLDLFLDSLQQAVDNKDKDFIIDHLSGNIMNSFGGDGGIEEFKEYWNWDEDASRFWTLMERLLEMGGGKYDPPKSMYTKRTMTYTIPYVSDMWPDYEPFEHVAITGENVSVRSQPNAEAEIVGELSLDVVKYNYELTDAVEVDPEERNPIGMWTWYHISTIDEKVSGYVHYTNVWSPVNYRMYLVRGNNKWIITSLIAGD